PSTIATTHMKKRLVSTRERWSLFGNNQFLRFRRGLFNWRCCFWWRRSEVRKFQAQVAGIGGVSEPSFEINSPFANQALDFTIKMLHAFGAADAHGVQQGLAFGFALLDILPSSQSGLEDFDCRNAAPAVFARNEAL